MFVHKGRSMRIQCSKISELTHGPQIVYPEVHTTVAIETADLCVGCLWDVREDTRVWNTVTSTQTLITNTHTHTHTHTQTYTLNWCPFIPHTMSLTFFRKMFHWVIQLTWPNSLPMVLDAVTVVLLWDCWIGDAGGVCINKRILSQHITSFMHSVSVCVCSGSADLWRIENRAPPSSLCCFLTWQNPRLARWDLQISQNYPE